MLSRSAELKPKPVEASRFVLPGPALPGAGLSYDAIRLPSRYTDWWRRARRMQRSRYDAARIALLGIGEAQDDPFAGVP